MERCLPGIVVFVFLIFSLKSGFSQQCNLDLSYTYSGCGACVVIGPGAWPGATAPYSYMWNTGISTQCNNGLPPGSYFVTVTSSTGCWDTITVNITSLPSLHVTMTPFG